MLCLSNQVLQEVTLLVASEMGAGLEQPAGRLCTDTGVKPQSVHAAGGLRMQLYWGGCFLTPCQSLLSPGFTFPSVYTEEYFGKSNPQKTVLRNAALVLENKAVCLSHSKTIRIILLPR